MTAVQAIAVVLIRLWAVGYLIVAFFGFFQSLSLLYDNQFFQVAHAYLQIAAYALLLVFWALVLSYSRTVTAWVLPPVKEAEHNIRIAPEDLISAGTFLVGVYYLTKYVPELLQSAPILISSYLQGSGSLSHFSNRAIELGGNLIAILIALWLILRPGHLVRLFSWLRTAGLPKEAASEGGSRKDE